MNILIIEDDPMVAMIHKEYCKKTALSLQVKHVSNLLDVKNVLQHWQPNLILLDNYLPDGKGVDFLDQFNNIPIIMITAASNRQIVQSAIEKGVVDYLVKPFTYERFELAIQKAKRFIEVFSNEQVSQEEIDKYFYIDNDKKTQIVLPKGLTKITLSKIVDAILEQRNSFTTQVVSEKVTISRITIKKYLNFLVDIQFLTEDVDYLTLGRPVTVYHIKDESVVKIVLNNV